MRYAYQISPEEVQEVFGELIQSEYDYDDRDYHNICRNGQDFDKLYDVVLSKPVHIKILLDYLSTDKRNWDYEPKLRITFKDEDTQFLFQRRGNLGHINHLEDGDCVIVDSYLRKELKRLAKFDSLVKLVDSKDETETIEFIKQKYENLILQHQLENKELRDQLSAIKNIVNVNVKDTSLPFG